MTDMKTEIQQVLKMNKEGTLTDEQATELLAELARQAPESGSSGARDWNRPGMVQPILSKVNSTVKYALDAAFCRNPPGGQGYPGEAHGGQESRNTVHMSHFEFPEGKEQVFTGNSIRMSSVKGMRLERAEMTDNTIDMSKADAIAIRDGKIIACEIRASSAADWSVDGATMRAVSIQGSKVAGLSCASGSLLRGLRIQSASVKDFDISEGSKLAEMLINGTAISDLKLARTSITAGEIQACKLAHVSMQACEIKDLMLRLMNIRNAHFADCVFHDAVFSGSENWVWKKQGLKDVRFENCRMEKVLFSNCRLADLVMKNITLRDRQFRDLDLRGKTLDGEAAFLEAARAD